MNVHPWGYAGNGRRRARRRDFDATTRQKQAVVYRAYDAEDRLLYIGCTVNFDQRMSYHRTTGSQWWPYAVRIEQDVARPFDDARAVEAAAIEVELPWFNGKDQGQVQRWRGTYRRAFDVAAGTCGCEYGHTYWLDPEVEGDECGRTWEQYSAAHDAAVEAANAEHGTCRDVAYRHHQYRIAAGLAAATEAVA